MKVLSKRKNYISCQLMRKTSKGLQLFTWQFLYFSIHFRSPHLQRRTCQRQKTNWKNLQKTPKNCPKSHRNLTMSPTTMIRKTKSRTTMISLLLLLNRLHPYAFPDSSEGLR